MYPILKRQCATFQGLNECSSNPCKNGATCNDYLGYYACSCESGFTGVNCEENINDCVHVTCPPMMHCVDGVDSFACRCKPGYLGEYYCTWLFTYGLASTYTHRHVHAYVRACVYKCMCAHLYYTCNKGPFKC